MARPDSNRTAESKQTTIYLSQARRRKLSYGYGA